MTERERQGRTARQLVVLQSVCGCDLMGAIWPIPGLATQTDGAIDFTIASMPFNVTEAAGWTAILGLRLWP